MFWYITLILLLLWPPCWAMGLDLDEARHLLARTSFGATAADLEALRPLSYEAAVERLLSSVRQQPRTPPPAWVDEPQPSRQARQAMSETERQAFQAQQRERGMALKAWWYQEMLSTDSPFTERMTLFWHNHFTSSLQKVRWPALLYRQNLLLRQHAVGNFRAFLHAMVKDPAMLLYLDAQTNRKGAPNENLARELLELFTLGEGHYSEQDIKEAARALTGWEVERDGQFRVNTRMHDATLKTFLGRTGLWDGDAIIDILLEQPRVAVHITEKLWRAFVSDTPDAAEVQRLATLFRQQDYALRPLFKALFMSPSFRATAQHGTMLKSPVELLVGTLRLFAVPMQDPERLIRVGRQLGQDVLDPPNVKGWPGGHAWITTSTLLTRQQFVQRVLRAQEVTMSSQGLLAEPGLPPERLTKLLLPIAPVQAPPAGARGSALVEHLVLDPAYQLQ